MCKIDFIFFGPVSTMSVKFIFKNEKKTHKISVPAEAEDFVVELLRHDIIVNQVNPVCADATRQGRPDTYHVQFYSERDYLYFMDIVGRVDTEADMDFYEEASNWKTHITTVNNYDYMADNFHENKNETGGISVEFRLNVNLWFLPEDLAMIIKKLKSCESDSSDGTLTEYS